MSGSQTPEPEVVGSRKYNLRPDLNDMLVRVLAEQALKGRPVDALKFRAQYRDKRAVLDELERHQMLQRDGNEYKLAGFVYPYLDSPEAREVLAHIEAIYELLVAHYEASQEAHVLVEHLSQASGLSMDDTIDTIGLLFDASLWYGGSTSDLYAPGAYLICRERILDYERFGDLTDEFLRWAKVLCPISGHASWVAQAPDDVVELSAQGVASRNATVAQRQVEDVSRTQADFVHAWQAARSCLLDFRLDDIKDIVGLGGLSLPAVAHLSSGSGGASKGQLMTAFDAQVAKLDAKQLGRLVTTVIEEMLRRKEGVDERLGAYLNRLGWSYVDSTLVPIEVLDVADLGYVPTAAHRDLLKAAQRMRDGDFSGAISAACGAVDAATSQVYLEQVVGDPTRASFQERCRKAVQARGMLASLQEELRELSWKEEDVVPFKRNLESALNSGAFVLQTLRSNMGDVHGTKPIAKSLAFECLRWSELIIAALMRPQDPV